VGERVARHDPTVIAERYADAAVLRSAPFREPRFGGGGVASYAAEAFGDEASAEFRFAEPIVGREGRAAVEYWAVVTAHDGTEATLFGVSVLRFGHDGRVLEHRDYWAMQGRRLEPHDTWGRRSLGIGALGAGGPMVLRWKPRSSA
jgi:hypothetical protein